MKAATLTTKEIGDPGRFWKKVDVGDCWEFIGARQEGYGKYRIGTGAVRRAHRVSFTLLVRELDGDEELDHLCRNRACVNPDHLEPVATRINVLRGQSPAAACARRRECENGHAFTTKNTHIDGRGKRHCRKCMPWQARVRLMGATR